MVRDLATPLRALLVALAGVVLAWLWFKGVWYYGLAAVLLVLALGYALDVVGRRLVKSKPVTAVKFLEWWILQPLVLAAAAAAAVIIVTVWLTLPDTTPAATKEVISALSTGITAFLTAIFVSRFQEDDDSSLSDHIYDVFRGAYLDLEPHSEKALWVYSSENHGVVGWNRAARLKRAEEIAKLPDVLKAKPQDTPAS